MNVRNLNLKKALGRMTTPEIKKELDNLPSPNTCNKEGHEAYSVSEELQLLSMLNTLKMEHQKLQEQSIQLLKTTLQLLKSTMQQTNLRVLLEIFRLRFNMLMHLTELQRHKELLETTSIPQITR